MCGASSRFFEAGFKRPKYELCLGDQSLLAWSLLSFKSYFDVESFLFICRQDFDAEQFIKKTTGEIGLPPSSINIKTLASPTLGQADTVYQGLKGTSLGRENITIFNVDTFYSGFKKITLQNNEVGFIDVVKAPGDHWSFVLPKNQTRKSMGLVSEVVEKKRISNLCSTGLYNFKDINTFRFAYERTYLKKTISQKSEHYLAPIYQSLITRGFNVKYRVLANNKVTFCGTPKEFKEAEILFSKIKS